MRQAYRNIRRESVLYKVEMWISLGLRAGAELENLCTFFGEMSLPMRPLVGETISFHQDRTSSLSFHKCVPFGATAEVNMVTVEVDSISHYGVRDDDGLPLFRTHVMCDRIDVPSLEDAKVIRVILEDQFGMEIDPYAINILDR